MKQFSFIIALCAISLLSGCELIGDIFAAGAYTGIIAVILVIAIIAWIISKVTRK